MAAGSRVARSDADPARWPISSQSGRRPASDQPMAPVAGHDRNRRRGHGSLVEVLYRRLGVPFPDDAETEPHVQATLPEGLRIAIDHIDVIRSLDPDWQPPAGRARIALAFLCDSPADVDATYAAAVAAGATGRLPLGMRLGSSATPGLRDPDGNDIDLFTPLDE